MSGSDANYEWGHADAVAPLVTPTETTWAPPAAKATPGAPPPPTPALAESTTMRPVRRLAVTMTWCLPVMMFAIAPLVSGAVQQAGPEVDLHPTGFALTLIFGGLGLFLVWVALMALWTHRSYINARDIAGQELRFR